MSRSFRHFDDLFVSRSSVETKMKKRLNNLRSINRLLKRLEKMDLNEESKDYLDRNKKILRSNLKIANEQVNDLTPKYTRSSSSYSSNYSSYESSDDSSVFWIIMMILFFFFVILSNA
tara:strand:+ start:94 stop:447 length:354 start_codon:yes stop_codon:yes gene_type:complete